MSTVPVLKPRQVIDRLTALGLVEVRQRGSRKQFPQLGVRDVCVSKVERFQGQRPLFGFVLFRHARWSQCHQSRSTSPKP